MEDTPNEMEMGLVGQMPVSIIDSQQCEDTESHPLLSDQHRPVADCVLFKISQELDSLRKRQSIGALVEATTSNHGEPTAPEEERSKYTRLRNIFETKLKSRHVNLEEVNKPEFTIQDLHKLHKELLRTNITYIVNLLPLPKDLLNDVIFTCGFWKCSSVSRTLQSSVNVAKILDKRVPKPLDHIMTMMPICLSARELKDSIKTSGSECWSLLHVASSMSSVSSVCLLLVAGADPLALDTRGRTVLDVVGMHGDQYDVGESQEAGEAVVIRILLQLGVNYNVSLNRSDSSYYTLLFAGIYVEKRGSDFPLEEVLRELLEAGAFTSSDCASKGVIKFLVWEHAKEILQLILNHASEHRCCYSNLTLITAVKEDWIDGVFIALLAGASITEIETIDWTQNSLHIASEKGHFAILNLLVAVAKYKRTEHGDYYRIKNVLPRHIKDSIAKERVKEYFEGLLEYEEPISDILNVKDNNRMSPIHYAVLNKHFNCFELLLKNNASMTCIARSAPKSLTVEVYTSVMHEAADTNQIEMVKLIYDHDKTALRVKDWRQRQPLHIACGCHNKDIIIFLLTKGADLFATDERSHTPFKLITDNFTDPAEIFDEVFNQHIGCYSRKNNLNTYTVNYNILKCGDKDLKVVKSLIRCGLVELLAHPLIESFLHLKWKSLAHLFYTMFAVYLCFVLTLNFFLAPWFYFKDKNEETLVDGYTIVWGCLLFVMLCLIAVQEILRIKTCRYYIQLETWLNWSIIVITISLPFVLVWESSESKWGRNLATADLLLSWTELTIMISSVPDWGVYLLMFGKVAFRIIKILLIFSFPIIGFSLAFVIQFQHQEPFNSLTAGFKKTLVMMTGEFDYSDTFRGANFATCIIFIAFVILFYMTLMNLIVGVSINDTNQLQEIGNIRKLEKQVEFLVSLERNVCLKFLKEKVFDRWIDNFVPNTIDLHDADHYYKFRNKMLPKHIKEAIIRTAKAWKRARDEDAHEKENEDKIREIHKEVLKGKEEMSKVTETLNLEINKLHEESSRKDKIIDALCLEIHTKNRINELNEDIVEEYKCKVEQLSAELSRYRGKST